MIRIPACLIVLSIFTSCTTTQSTASRQTLESRMVAQNAAVLGAIGEPPPPGEGFEDIAADGSGNPDRNPASLPTPLLRANAAAGL